MKNDKVLLSKLKNKKSYTELWYLIILITLGFYFCPPVIIKIIKILVITIIPIIMWLLIYSCHMFIISKNQLSSLIRNKKFTKANKIIHKRYNTLEKKEKKIYDFYKILINYYQSNDTSILTIEQNLTIIKLYMEDITEATDEISIDIKINCYSLIAENYLLLYDKRKEQSDIENFKIYIDNIYNIIESCHENLSDAVFYRYMFIKINLLLKVNAITNDSTYLNDILTCISELKNNITTYTLNQTIFIEHLLSIIYIKIYKSKSHISDINMAMHHLKNLETIIDNIKFYKRMHKRYGKLMLVHSYQQIMEVKNLYDNQDIFDKKKIKYNLNKKDRILLKRINTDIQIIYPINNLNINVKKMYIISKKTLSLLIVLMIISFIFSSIHYFGPPIKINLTNNQVYCLDEIKPITLLPVLNTNSKLFMENLNTSFLNNNIHLKKELKIEEDYSFVLDDKGDIILNCSLDLYNSISSLTLYIDKENEKNWSDIIPYIASIIQADKIEMNNEETKNLIDKLSLNTSEPTEVCINNRKYTLIFRNNKIYFSIYNSKFDDYFEFEDSTNLKENIKHEDITNFMENIKHEDSVIIKEILELYGK